MNCDDTFVIYRCPECGRRFCVKARGVCFRDRCDPCNQRREAKMRKRWRCSHKRKELIDQIPEGLYVIISCPTEDYSPGSHFRAENIRWTLEMGHFIPGMIIYHGKTQKIYRVIGKELEKQSLEYEGRKKAASLPFDLLSLERRRYGSI